MAAALAAKDKLWNCAECRKAKLDGARHCREKSPFPMYEINGEKFYTCPVGHITRESYEALALYSVYKDGFLPEAGGIMDQDNRIMEQMRIIARAVHEAQKKK